MSPTQRPQLSRRERQIMDVVYRLGRANAADVRRLLPDAPSYSTVRALLRVLEEKGHLHHEADGPRYVFVPTIPRDKAGLSALRQLLATFFDDSTEQAVAALLDLSSAQLTPREYDRLSGLIARARKEGR
jgi:predicted transcriptional regulator